MPKYRLTLDDGRVINATADTEADATAAAQSWAKVNPAGPKKDPSLGEEISGAVTGAIDKFKRNASAYATDTVAMAERNPRQGLIRNIGDAVKNDVAAAGLIKDAAGVALSPVAGLIHGALVRPGANLLDKIPVDTYTAPKVRLGRRGLTVEAPRVETPDERHARDENIVNTALTIAAPARPGPGLIKAPSSAAGMIRRFDAAQVDPMLAAAGGKGSAALTNAVAENPIAGVAARGRLRKAMTQTETSAEGLARRYGETRGPQITGENVQRGVSRYARDRRDPTSFAAKSGQRYDQVFADIDAAMAGKTSVGASQIDTPATTAALQQINSSSQSAAIAELVADPTLSKVAATLSEARGAKDMSFGDLRRLRTWVRDAQKDPELRQKIGPANLSRLEGTLTQDIYANAEKLASPALANQLRRTDRLYAAGQARIENALQSFADAASGESAYRRIEQAAGSSGTADAAKLLSLKRSLAPDEWGDVAANMVSEMGKATPGIAPAGEAGFSVSRFVTRYNQLSPRGRDILFGSVGGGGAKASALRAELDNLATVADDLKNIEKGANTSKSGVSVQSVGTLGGLINPATTIPTAKLLSGMALTGEIMTNPTAVRWLVKLGQAGKVGAPAVASVVKQLERAAKANAALMPLYQQSQGLLRPPIGATAAAEDRTP